MPFLDHLEEVDAHLLSYKKNKENALYIQVQQ
jgi:hypothetical protein